VISTDRYQMMVATGVLTKYGRVELIEGDMLVSDSSLSFDQTVKLNLYARYVVSEYWIVGVKGIRIVTWREPTVNGYLHKGEFAAADIVAPQAFPDVKIAVGEIFGQTA
jgi:Uma2 family endonuclease